MEIIKISKNTTTDPRELTVTVDPPAGDETPGFGQFGGDQPRLRGPDDPHTLTLTGIPRQVDYPYIVSTQEVPFKFWMLETFQK